MYEKIRDVQNGFWAAFRTFIKTRDIAQWTSDIARLEDRYRYDKNMLGFCESLSCAWAKFINQIKEWEL